jgi:hypothetical protein
MRFLLSVAVAFACLISTAGLHAQSSQSREARIAAAKEAFAVGTRAYADGEFKTALTSFQRAYDLTGSPDLLYNIATVSDRMRRDEQALERRTGPRGLRGLSRSTTQVGRPRARRESNRCLARGD